MISGVPLGCFQNPSYQSLQQDLAVGDVLLMLSDGLAEVEDSSGDYLGYKAIEQCFNAQGSETPQKIIQALMNKGHSWNNGKPNEDDITLVVVKKID